MNSTIYSLFVAMALRVTVITAFVMLIYLTDSGQYKVVIGTECRSTAPNGGLFRYGEPAVARYEYSDDSVYKADASGNVTILADNVNEWLYVPENEDMTVW